MGRASKDKRDIYYRVAKEQGYRARSAFKLLQIERAFRILQGARSVVDLCAAPGGWTQVLSKQLAAADEVQRQEATRSAPSAAATESASASATPRTAARIVAVDLQAMEPLPGVHFIQGDLTRAATAQLILQALSSKQESDAAMPAAADPSASVSASSASPLLADVVLCDGAPDVLGMHDVDEAIQHELLLAAINVALHILKPSAKEVEAAPVADPSSAAASSAAAVAAPATASTSAPPAVSATAIASASASATPAQPPTPLSGGCFVAKVFRGRAIDSIYALLQRYFARVSIAKPKCSRTSSIEAFLVCQGYRGLEAVGQGNRAMEQRLQLSEVAGVQPLPVPFFSCWDEARLDSDRSYPLDDSHAAASSSSASSSSSSSSSSSASASASLSLAPSAMPIDPPYRRALAMRMQNRIQ